MIRLRLDVNIYFTHPDTCENNWYILDRKNHTLHQFKCNQGAIKVQLRVQSVYQGLFSGVHDLFWRFVRGSSGCFKCLISWLLVPDLGANC
jgi:hypothetical protein